MCLDQAKQYPRRGFDVRVCAIVVTYHPDESFVQRFIAIADQVESVFIVDNASTDSVMPMLFALTEPDRHYLVRNPTNRGIAEALNQGIRLARTHGFEWAITLDQDSMASPGMVTSLVRTAERFSDYKMVALIGPRIVHQDMNGLESAWLRQKKQCPVLFERKKCTGDDLDGVTMVITSGALMNLLVCERLGMLWSDLFIDYVDTEYCLRARKAGYDIIISCNAVMHHQLGAKRLVRRLGLKMMPTFHDQSRIYYMSRNRVHVMRRHAASFPHWVAFDIIAMMYNLARIVIAERDRHVKLLAFLRGTRDGFRGLLGQEPQ